MNFQQPYYVTKHAREQFQKRVASLEIAEAIKTIQHLLQEENNPKLIEIGRANYSPYKMYLNYYERRSVYLPVVYEKRGKWPIVATVMSEESTIHWKYIRGEFMGLYYDPLTISGVAYILNVDRSTVYDWIEKGYLKCLKKPRDGSRSKISWTALEKFMKKHPELWNAAKLNINPLDYKIKVPWFEQKYKQDKRLSRENLNWADWEDNIIKELYPEDPQKCYKILKRSETAIKIRACRLRKCGQM